MMQTPETQLQRILAISNELISNRSLDDILRQIVQVAAELTDCETVDILLLDEPSNTLRFAAATLNQDRIVGVPVPINGSIAGMAFAGDQPIIVNNAREDPHFYPKIDELFDYQAHSILCVPLKFQDRKIGVLEAANKQGGQSFRETDAQVLTAFATQATIAIENARLFERYKQMAESEHTQHQMADALRLAGAAINSTLDYDQVIDRILEQVDQVIPNDTSHVMMVEEGDLARVFHGRGYAEFGTAEVHDLPPLDIKNAAGLRRMSETRQPVVFPDVLQEPTWYFRPEHQWIRSYVGAPIIVREAIVGFLGANSATPNFYNQTHAEGLQAFAHQAATAIENARLYRQAQEEIAERIKVEEELRRHRDHLEELVKERTAEVHRLAITDPLTDIFNRRHLMTLGNQALDHARRYQHPLAAMMLDIDHFKEINDTYGHAVGDEALRRLADQIRKDLRSTDILGRYGGEEFVVLMPETGLQEAHQLAERLLVNIRALRIDTVQDQFGFTVSVGVAELDHAGRCTIDGLIVHADKAMYMAKDAGRDRVAAYRLE